MVATITDQVVRKGATKTKPAIKTIYLVEGTTSNRSLPRNRSRKKGIVVASLHHFNGFLRSMGSDCPRGKTLFGKQGCVIGRRSVLSLFVIYFTVTFNTLMCVFSKYNQTNVFDSIPSKGTPGTPLSLSR